MSRVSPRDRFILKFGVLYYGGGVFILFNVLHAWRLHARGASLAGEVVMLLVTAILAPLLGWAFGALAWSRLARRSRKQ